MGVVNKLKRLHKQDMLKPKSIKRVVIADDAGVNNEKYLNRARTLESYVNGDKKEDQSENEISLQSASVSKAQSVKSSQKRTKQFKM